MKTVLVVDDTPALLSLLTAVVQSAKHLPVQAACGEDAMVIADRTPVDVLITDIRMPGMNGFELAHLLRQSRPGLPILFISGYFDSAAEEHMEWIQRPKVGFLPKPFPPGALLRNLELLLAS